MKNYIGIYFVSKHGQTRKIASHLARWLEAQDAEVRVIDLERPPDDSPPISDFDSVLVGAPVYRYQYSRAVRRFIRTHRQELSKLSSTGFFSTCLTATPDTPEAHAESLGPVRDFLDETAWSPQWIASFPGALNYPEYNPLLRWMMKRISANEGGPTDTSKDYYLTRWDEVSEFAAHFLYDEPESRYRASRVSRATKTLNSLMPNFEQRIVQRIEIEAVPDEVRLALETMELEDMPLAEVLARIRNFGQVSEGYSEQQLFQDAAETFGVVRMEMGQAHEVLGGLVGQFWKRDYGVWRIRNTDDFREFGTAGYTKVLTNFWFDELKDGKTMVRMEIRIHSFGAAAQRKFGWYWFVVSLGVRLYMRSVLSGIRRSVERKRWQGHVMAA